MSRLGLQSWLCAVFFASNLSSKHFQEPALPRSQLNLVPCPSNGTCCWDDEFEPDAHDASAQPGHRLGRCIHLFCHSRSSCELCDLVSSTWSMSAGLHPTSAASSDACGRSNLPLWRPLWSHCALDRNASHRRPQWRQRGAKAGRAALHGQHGPAAEAKAGRGAGEDRERLRSAEGGKRINIGLQHGIKMGVWKKFDYTQ